MPFLRLDFSPEFLFLPGWQTTSNCDLKHPSPCLRCTPGPATDKESYLSILAFLAVSVQICSPHPHPVLLQYQKEMKPQWELKRAVTPFVPCLLTALPTQSYSTQVRLQCDIPAWERNDEVRLQLQTSDTQKPKASVSTRSAQDPSQSNGIVAGRIHPLPWPQDPPQGPRSPVRLLFWR